MTPRKSLSLFAFGALGGTALDHLHVMGGVLGYPAAAFWGEAWWVPPVFGAAILTLVWPWHLLFRGGAPKWPSPAPVALYLGEFTLAYCASVAFRERPLLDLGVLLLAWLPFAWSMGRPVALFGLMAALGGVLTEALLCRVGAFSYFVPGLMGPLLVPIWLPALYLHAGLLTRAIDATFLDPRGA